MDPKIALAIALISEDPVPKRKRRSKWCKRWLLEREKFGHGALLEGIRLNEPMDFRNFMRMDSDSFDELLTLVAPIIEKKNTVMRPSIPPHQRLSIALRYLATGDLFEDLKFLTAVSPQAIGGIVFETCQAIICVLREYIKLPDNEQEWKFTADAFKDRWNFPHCVGAVDGKHIRIKKPPPGSGSFYYNCKGYFSIVLMAFVDSNYEFLMVDVGLNGRVSDGGVINQTKFGEMLYENGLCLPKPDKLRGDDIISLPYVFVGDDAFSLTENFLKPYGGELSGEDNVNKRIFNYRLSRARRIVENAFGILASRFGVFQKDIPLKPEKVQIVTLACCYLHNFLRRKSRKYFVPGCVDWEGEEGEVHAGNYRSNFKVCKLLRPGICLPRLNQYETDLRTISVQGDLSLGSYSMLNEMWTFYSQYCMNCTNTTHCRGHNNQITNNKFHV